MSNLAALFSWHTRFLPQKTASPSVCQQTLVSGIYLSRRWNDRIFRSDRHQQVFWLLFLGAACGLLVWFGLQAT